MNRNKSDEIESRLDRSLRNQVRAPKLDGRFDAGVWDRIGKSAATTANSSGMTPSKAPRWLLASNIIGIAVAIALVAIVTGRAFTGVDLNVEIPAVTVSPGLVDQLIAVIGWPIAAIALLFGLKSTALGRRLRAEFF
jgi:hypothetical protein